MLLSLCYKAEQWKWGTGSEYIVFWSSVHVCVCPNGVGGWRWCTNQAEYHQLANIRAEEIKILKVTEQFHQDNYATINWIDKGSDISESYNNVLLLSLGVCRDLFKAGFKNKQIIVPVNFFLCFDASSSGNSVSRLLSFIDDNLEDFTGIFLLVYTFCSNIVKHLWAQTTSEM